MALVGNNRGSGGNITSATTISISPQQNFSSNTLAVLALAYDNSGSQGSDPYSSITDNAGNTWTSRANGLNDPGAASAGSTLRIFTSSVTNLLTTNSITVTFNNATVAKSWTLTEFSSNQSGFYANYLNSYTTVTGTGTGVNSQSITQQAGNAVLAALANEGNATITADINTNFGTWSTIQTASNGTGTSGMQVGSQFKIVTSAGQIQWNITLSASGDWVCGAIVITELSSTPATTFDPFGMMGYYGI